MSKLDIKQASSQSDMIYLSSLILAPIVDKSSLMSAELLVQFGISEPIILEFSKNLNFNIILNTACLSIGKLNGDFRCSY